MFAIARAAMKTYGKHQTEVSDSRSTAEFLFGKKANGRTGEPGTTGWTTKVDQKLEHLDDRVGDVAAAVKEVGRNVVKGLRDSPPSRPDKDSQ